MNSWKHVEFTMKRKNAFTLIELLVVVAIIAVLVALLLPAIAKTREMARRTMCASNLRMIGVGYMGYAQVYNKFPRPFPWPWGGYELDYMEKAAAIELNRFIAQKVLVADNPATLQDFTADNVKMMVWNCPSVPPVYSTMFWNTDGRDYFWTHCYIFTTWLNPCPWRYFGSMSPAKPEDPIGPIVVEKIVDDCNWTPKTPTGWYGNHTGGNGIMNVEGLNEVYSDGHAKWFSVFEMPKNPPTGNNSWMFAEGSEWPHYYWVEK
jgi:prepilin-type N-terminal cleavage/methylation domain-containing protein